MNFDIRIPIGAMFTLMGGLLVGYGVLSDAAIYRRSFSLNLNLLWGGVLLLFGIVMWLFGRRGARLEAAQASAASGASTIGDAAVDGRLSAASADVDGAPSHEPVSQRAG